MQASGTALAGAHPERRTSQPGVLQVHQVSHDFDPQITMTGLFMFPALLLGSMGVVVANAFIHMLDGLLSKLQSFRAVAALVVFRPLQFFRGRLQVTERFLHVGLIFAESESRH
jgi:hypothetical protein